MKKFLKNHIELFLIVVISAITFCITLSDRLFPGDTLWNFGNIYKYYNGDVLYTQVNYILTPIYIVIGKILFSIFAPNFIVFAIYNCIIISCLFLIFYKILKLLKVREDFSVITTLICFLSIQDRLIMPGANYNTLAFVFFELGILFMLKAIINKSENNFKSNLLQAISLFLVFFTNQKLGVGYIIGLIIFELIRYKKHGISTLLKIAGLFIIELSVALFVFYLRGNLYDFINICFLGIYDFKQNIIIDIGALYIIIFISSLVFSIVTYKNIKSDEVRNNIKLLMSFAIGSFVLSIPIFNGYHCGIPGILFILLLIYSLYECLKDLFVDENFESIFKRAKLILVIIFILCLPKYTINLIRYKDYRVRDINSPYFGAIIKDEFRKNIKVVTEYLTEQEEQGKQTYIVSNYAMFYVIETGVSHDYFDMLNIGNYGINGDDNLIEKIKDMNNTVMLVYNKERSKYECYQITVKIKEYIESNYKCVGRVENYDVYEIEN